MEWFIGWIVFSFVAAAIAGAKNRSTGGYFLLSLVLSPLVGIILAAALPKLELGPSPQTHVRCPDCREFVLNEARKCKHCGAALVPLSAQSACRYCHKTIQPGQKLCPHCGVNLT